MHTAQEPEDRPLVTVTEAAALAGAVPVQPGVAADPAADEAGCHGR